MLLLLFEFNFIWLCYYLILLFVCLYFYFICYIIVLMQLLQSFWLLLFLNKTTNSTKYSMTFHITNIKSLKTIRKDTFLSLKYFNINLYIEINTYTYNYLNIIITCYTYYLVSFFIFVITLFVDIYINVFVNNCIYIGI